MKKILLLAANIIGVTPIFAATPDFPVTPVIHTYPVPLALAPVDSSFSHTLEPCTFCHFTIFHSAIDQVKMFGENFSAVECKTHLEWRANDNPYKRIIVNQEDKTLFVYIEPSTFNVNEDEKANYIIQSMQLGKDLLWSSCKEGEPVSRHHRKSHHIVPYPQYTQTFGGKVFDPTHISIGLYGITEMDKRTLREIAARGFEVEPISGTQGVFLHGAAERVRQLKHFILMKEPPHIQMQTRYRMRCALSKGLVRAADQLNHNDTWSYYEIRIPKSAIRLQEAAVFFGFKRVKDIHSQDLPWLVYQRHRST